MGTFLDRLNSSSLLMSLCQSEKKVWEQYIHHPFVQKLKDGTLPEKCFRYYLTQDYRFLINYARAYMLAAYKADDVYVMRYFLDAAYALFDQELDMHIDFCAQWGISKEQVMDMPESLANVAYTRYVLEKGMQGDILDLYMALIPCMMGYAEIGSLLLSSSHPHHPYRQWIERYGSKEFQNIAYEAEKMLNYLAQSRFSNSRHESLACTFHEACQLESQFWQMGLQGPGENMEEMK